MGSTVGYQLRFLYANSNEEWSLAIERINKRVVAKTSNLSGSDDGFPWGFYGATSFKGKFAIRNLFNPECVLTHDNSGYLFCRYISLDLIPNENALLWETLQ